MSKSSTISETGAPSLREGTIGRGLPRTELRGEGILKALELPWLKLKNFFGGFIPEDLNPTVQLGAIANITFVIAVITGILVLFWYVPSVDGAYSSLEAAKSSFLGQLMRSLHRYSSDAAMLFALLHALQILFARKVGGPRWLAWITGFLAIGALWFIGWLGYWLVWDDRAVGVARGTAKFFDSMGIFAEPLGRSFLTAENVNSLLFFLVFFLHMILPLVWGIIIWIHIARVSRARFLTTKRMTLAITLSLIAISLVYPAYSSAPAHLQKSLTHTPIDYYYLAPLLMTERLSEGALWAVFLGVGIVFLTMPSGVLKKKAPPARIIPERCVECRQCYADCPFNAISMIARLEGKKDKYPHVAHVDPNLCVGCGVCVGSCDSQGVEYPALPVSQFRKELEKQLKTALEAEEKPIVAFLCAESAAYGLKYSPSTRRSKEMPEYLIFEVPCAGWVHSLIIERAVRYGAEGCLIVGCGPDAQCREGNLWTELRLKGKRSPKLRCEKVGSHPVLYLEMDRGEQKEMLRAAEIFKDSIRKSHSPEEIVREVGEVLKPADKAVANCDNTFQRKRKTFLSWAVGLAAALLFSFLTAGPSFVWSRVFPDDSPILVVSFKHDGKLVSVKSSISPSFKGQKLPDYILKLRRKKMQPIPIELTVSVDGKELFRKTFPPPKVFKGRSNIATVELPVKTGLHTVSITLTEKVSEGGKIYREEKKLKFEPKLRYLLLFDQREKFRWRLPGKSPASRATSDRAKSSDK